MKWFVIVQVELPMTAMEARASRASMGNNGTSSSLTSLYKTNANEPMRRLVLKNSEDKVRGKAQVSGQLSLPFVLY
jgi:hypothetical protein